MGTVVNRNGTLSFRVTVPYTYPDGTVIDVTYTVSNSNVVRVDRREIGRTRAWWRGAAWAALRAVRSPAAAPR